MRHKIFSLGGDIFFLPYSCLPLRDFPDAYKEFHIFFPDFTGVLEVGDLRIEYSDSRS